MIIFIGQTIRSSAILLIAAFFLILYAGVYALAGDPPLIILDTDISSDVDDVGAVAVLHALADQDKAQILAMMVSSGDPWSAPCLDALNTWYGRPDIPIGMINGESVRHESKYTAAIAFEFPHDLKTGAQAPDAVALYRRILSEQENKSVVLVTIGYLTNLRNLLQSQPDEISPLNGLTLVRQKVEKMVCMGGQYPEGREWNFYQDTPSTEFVIKKWPTSVTFCGFEVGRNIMTGSILQSLPTPHPVRRSYQLYNGITDRPSWDQLAVLYAVEWNANVLGIPWRLSPFGDNRINSNGFNKWMSSHSSVHNYLTLDISPERVAKLIDYLMLEPAAR